MSHLRQSLVWNTPKLEVNAFCEQLITDMLSVMDEIAPFKVRTVMLGGLGLFI